MRMLHHGALPATTDLAWFFRVAPLKGGAPVLVVSGSMLVSHGPDAPARKEDERAAAHRLAPGKLKGDLLVSGNAYPNPAEMGHRRAVRVALEMGRWRKELSVYGDRVWLPGALSTQMSEPAAFTTMPIDYAHAYGGPGFAWNPLGLGAGPGPRGQMLPNVEFTDRRVENPSSQPGPAGFGPIDAAWRPRADRLGTYDSNWLAEYWPGHPEDFAPEFWNEAPADQQFIGGFKGDEVLAVLNMHAEQPRAEIQLPRLRARAFIAKADGGFTELALMLDTFAVDMEAGQTELVWRGAAAMRSARLRDIAFLFTMTEPLDAPVPHETCLALFHAARQAKYPNDAEREAAAAQQEAAHAVEAKTLKAALAKDMVAATAIMQALSTNAQARKAAHPAPGGEPKLPKLHEKAVPAAAMLLADLQAAAAGQHTPWSRVRVIEAHAKGQDMEGADLTGLDLSALNLSGAKLAKTVLAQADLSGAWLQGARLEGADFTGAEAVEANFSGASLTGARFKETALQGARFAEAGLSNAVFDGAALEQLSFDGAHGVGASFVGAKLGQASFRQAQLPGADFSNALLSGVDFEAALLTATKFIKTIGEGTNFKAARLDNIRANEAVFSRARFTGCTAPRSIWLQARLDYADFSRSLLPRANFCEAELDHANFDRAILEEAKFDEALMQFAVVTNAKLVRASLEGADLRDADFSGSNLYQAGLFRVRASRLRLADCFLAGTLMAR